MKTEEFNTMNFKLKHEHLEAAIINYLNSYNFISGIEVTSIDLGLTVDDDGCVEMDLNYIES